MIGCVWYSSADAKPPTADGIPTALQDYVAAKDDSFAWKLLKNDSSDGFLTYDIDLTSQVWQGITWKHALTVFVPVNNLQHKDTVSALHYGREHGRQAWRRRSGDGPASWPTPRKCPWRF